MAELRQHYIRVDGLLDEHDVQLGSVLFENRHIGIHALIHQQQMDRSRMHSDHVEHTLPITSF